MKMHSNVLPVFFPAVAAGLLAGLAGGAGVSADVAGFGDTGSGWTFNAVNAAYTPSVVSNALELTSASSYEGTSAWYDTVQNVGGSWTASFTWQLAYTQNVPGDGFVFEVQTGGVSQVGTADGTKAGWLPAGNYIGAGLENYPSFYYGTQYYQTGGSGLAPILGAGTTGSLNLATDTNPINFTVTYDATAQTLSMTGTDPTITGGTFTDTQTGVNIATILGSSTGYVGFTGGSGAADEQQNISNFSFVSTPEPASLGLFAIAGAGMLLLKRRRGAV